MDLTTRDSASHAPLSAARIDLLKDDFATQGQTDQLGHVRLARIPKGPVALHVRRVGYAERWLTVAVRADTSVEVLLVRSVPRLPELTVSANLTGIDGRIATSDFVPVVGARVQVLGTKAQAVTDSSGAFLIALVHPGTYFVRLRRDGLADELYSVRVPRAQVVDGSRVMTRGAPRRDQDWIDLEQRLRWRTTNSALVTGADLAMSGGPLLEALQRAPDVVLKNLRISPAACVFLDGVPKPGWPLEGFAPENIEAVEVYSGQGDATGMLAQRWPPGVPCSDASGRLKPDERVHTARFVVLWTRRRG